MVYGSKKKKKIKVLIIKQIEIMMNYLMIIIHITQIMIV